MVSAEAAQWTGQPGSFFVDKARSRELVEVHRLEG